MFTTVSLQIVKRFPSFISVFHKIFMLDFCPTLSFIVIFPSLFTIFSSPPFGPLWQNMSALFHVHLYIDEHCFNVSKGHPLTEKRRGHGILSCDSSLAGMVVFCATPHLFTSGRQPQINLAYTGGEAVLGNQNMPSAALTKIQFPVSVFKGS